MRIHTCLKAVCLSLLQVVLFIETAYSEQLYICRKISNKSFVITNRPVESVESSCLKYKRKKGSFNKVASFEHFKVDSKTDSEKIKLKKEIISDSSPVDGLSKAQLKELRRARLEYYRLLQ